MSDPELVVDNTVGRALLKAQRLGKPLLVVVIPQDATARYDRGHLWGEFLNFGDSAVWPLALAEVICATTKEIAELAPVKGEPMFVVLEGEPATATAHDTKVPSFNEMLGKYEEDGAPKLVEERIQKLGELVKRALAADAKMIDERRAFAMGVLGADSERFATELKKGISTTIDARFDAYAAIVADLMTHNAAVQNVCRAQLVEAVNARLKTKKIEGSRWTQSSGCGPDMHEDATPEEREKLGMYDCGMGFVPNESSRFLTFYTSTEKV